MSFSLSSRSIDCASVSLAGPTKIRTWHRWTPAPSRCSTWTSCLSGSTALTILFSRVTRLGEVSWLLYIRSRISWSNNFSSLMSPFYYTWYSAHRTKYRFVEWMAEYLLTFDAPSPCIMLAYLNFRPESVLVGRTFDIINYHVLCTLSVFIYTRSSVSRLLDFVSNISMFRWALSKLSLLTFRP